MFLMLWEDKIWDIFNLLEMTTYFSIFSNDLLSPYILSMVSRNNTFFFFQFMIDLFMHLDDTNHGPILDLLSWEIALSAWVSPPETAVGRSQHLSAGGGVSR